MSPSLNTMIDYQTLMREHDALSVMATGLHKTIADDAADIAEAIAARAVFSAALIEHVSKEDSAIYPRLIAGEDASAAAAARDVVIEFRDLMGDWLAYIGAWPDLRIAAEWPAFVQETQDLITRLHGRVKRENELIYPLALRASHIRLRA